MVQNRRAGLIFLTLVMGLASCSDQAGQEGSTPAQAVTLDRVARLELGTTNSGRMLIVHARHSGGACTTPVLEGPEIAGETATFTPRAICAGTGPNRQFVLATLIEDTALGEVTTFIVNSGAGAMMISREETGG